MRNVLSIAAIMAVALTAPAAAENTLRLVCKCQRIVINYDTQRNCAGQSDRIAIVDLDKSTLQWSNGAGLVWPAIEASVSADRIVAGIDPSKPRLIPGRLEINSYSISRITGEFEEDGMGHFFHPATPRIDSLVPATVFGVCAKIDAAKF
jgi:hypothetical protein